MNPTIDDPYWIDPETPAIMLVGDAGILLGYAQMVDRLPMEKFALGEEFDFSLGRTMLDATSLASDIDPAIPDLSAYPFELLVRFGSRGEVRVKNCTIIDWNDYYLSKTDRYIVFERARVHVAGRPQTAGLAK